jgi:hypothetical protein
VLAHLSKGGVRRSAEQHKNGAQQVQAGKLLMAGGQPLHSEQMQLLSVPFLMTRSYASS